MISDHKDSYYISQEYLKMKICPLPITMSSRFSFVAVFVFSSSFALHIPTIHGQNEAFFQDLKYDSNSSVIKQHHAESKQSGGDTDDDHIIEQEPFQVPKNPLLVSQQFNRDNHTIFQREETVNLQQSRNVLPFAQQYNEPTSNGSIYQRVKKEPLQKPGSFLSIFEYSNRHANDKILREKQLQSVSQQSNSDTYNHILRRVKRQQYYKIDRKGVTQPQPFCTKYLCRRPSATTSPRRSWRAQSHCEPGSRFDRKSNACRKVTGS